jgi:hypothetical protein
MDELSEKELESYLELEPDNERMSLEQKKQFYRNQYELIKADRLILIESIQAARATKDEAGLSRLMEQARRNYRYRVYYVNELRKLGENIDDHLVPLSKTDADSGKS